MKEREQNAPPDAESILVHGSHRIATSAVALALALRSGRSVAWADCSAGESNGEAKARAWVSERAGPPVVDRVESDLLRPTVVERASVERLVLAASGEELARLLDHLALPELFQRLSARAGGYGRAGAVLLTNVDGLRPELRASSIETVRLHETLHAQGLSVVATSRAVPTNTLDRPFDRIFRVELAEESRWTEATIAEERGGVPAGGARPVPLSEAWRTLGLDPALLAVP